MNTTKIGLGLAAIGRPEYINIRDNTSIDKSFSAFKKNALEMLDFAYKIGVRYFDTAASYGKGEDFLKKWHNKTNHTDAVIGTKWGYTYVANWELGYSGKHEIKEHSLEKLKEQWQASKSLLPNLKIYQIHSATFDSGVLDNVDVLNELHKLKKTHNLKIGLTSSGSNQQEVIKKSLEIEIEGKALFDSYQVTYNILEQAAFPILEKLVASKKIVIIKEALANGRVFLKDLQSETLNQLAQKYKVGIDAVALRFVIDTLNPTYVLSGASTIDQLKENYKALDFQLTKSEIEDLKMMKETSSTYWNERNKLSWH
ncbi:MAG TPA: aldo/keto reductase [Marinilabiliaceae bacterium]|nr:aldo/keto reductase [Marinilabiliaceae bacterium]